jgi:hypothetical protein
MYDNVDPAWQSPRLEMFVSCRGFFCPKSTDMPTCCADMSAPTQTMLATLSRVGYSNAVSMLCRHADMATCQHYVGKKLLVCSTFVNEKAHINQIDDAAVALVDGTVWHRHFGRRIGQPLKIAAALGCGSSCGGRRSATRASTLTSCDKGGD